MLVACVAVLDLLTHPHTRSGLEHMLFARVGLMLTLPHCSVPSHRLGGCVGACAGSGVSFRVVLITHFMAGCATLLCVAERSVLHTLRGTVVELTACDTLTDTPSRQVCLSAGNTEVPPQCCSRDTHSPDSSTPHTMG